MTKAQLAKRVIDYVRMDIERGNISEYCPVGIAYKDYERAAKEEKESRSTGLQQRKGKICPACGCSSPRSEGGGMYHCRRNITCRWRGRLSPVA
jgi:hypothetical protein